MTDKQEIIDMIVGGIREREELISELSVQMEKCQENAENLACRLEKCQENAEDLACRLGKSIAYILDKMEPMTKEYIQQCIDRITLADLRDFETVITTAFRKIFKGRIYTSEGTQIRIIYYKDANGGIIRDVDGEKLCNMFFTVLKHRGDPFTTALNTLLQTKGLSIKKCGLK